jgi:hypothetical protein
MKIASAAGSAVSTGAAVSVDQVSIAVFGLPLQTVLAGFGGALFGLSVFTVTTLWRAGIYVLANTAAAGYTTKLAHHIFGLPDGVQLGTSFIIGAGAQVFLTIFVGWLRKRFLGEP